MPTVSPIEIDLFPSTDCKVKALAEDETERAKERAAKLQKHEYSYGAVEQVFTAKTGINLREKKADRGKVSTSDQILKDFPTPALLTNESVLESESLYTKR